MLKGLAMRNRLLATATVGLALAAAPAAALASDGVIDVQDRCDGASFNAAGIDCFRPVGDGGGSVTLDELFATLAAKREHSGWRFKDDKVTIKQGQALKVTMSRGGEGHTVTEVSSFGLGCVPPINELVFPGQDPTAFPAACADSLTFTPGAFVPGGNLIAPGLPFEIAGLSKGTHRFMCMIHPWMKSTVTVK
jgi:plastocyanin